MEHLDIEGNNVDWELRMKDCREEEVAIVVVVVQVDIAVVMDKELGRGDEVNKKDN